MTLCTIVTNLTTGEAVLLGRGAEAVTIPLAGLARAGGTPAGPAIPLIPGRQGPLTCLEFPGDPAGCAPPG